MGGIHIPVLLNECIDGLNIDPNGTYVDGTLGRGGHSEKIAERLHNGKLICIDRDAAAIEEAGRRLARFGEKVKIVKANFRDLGDILNGLGISEFTLRLTDRDGVLEFVRNGESLTLPFDLCKNKLAKFSFGERAVADRMGQMEAGAYDCAISGAWIDKNTFAIQAQVIDTYFGCLTVTICFKDHRATLLMRRSGQYIFEGIDGFVIGAAIND